MNSILLNAKKIAPIILSSAYIVGCSEMSLAAPQTQKNSAQELILDTHFEENLIIPVTINNKTRRFLVDTGMSVTVIDKNIAAEVTQPIPLSELPKNYRQELQTLTTVYSQLQKQHYEVMEPRPFLIGSQKIQDNDLWLAMDLSLLVQFLGVDIDGIIGIGTFRKINWQIDNENKRLVLTKDAPSANSYQQCIGYDDSYNRMPQLWFNYSDNDVAFRVDTGADESYVSSDFMQFARKVPGAVTLYSKASPTIDASGINDTRSTS
jgi:hypothetical protein